MKDRIRSLLINNIKASEIASIVGCSPSYISQLAKDEEFKASVEAGKLAAQVERTEEDHIDVRYQTLEHKVLTSIEDSLCEASLGEKVRTLEAINKRKDAIYSRKNPAPQQQLGVNVNIVQLSLPSHATKNMGPVVEMNNKSEIVAISGRALAPLSADGVKNLFSAIASKKQQEQMAEIKAIEEEI